MLDQMRQEAEKAAIEARLASLPPPSPYTDAELEVVEAQHAAHALWQEWLRFERLHPGSPFCRDALHRMLADWRCLEACDEIDAIEHRLTHADHHTCPRCQHRWPADPMTVSRLQDRRTELLSLIDGRPRPARPALSPGEIMQHLSLIEDRDAYADEWQQLKDVAEVLPPALSLAEIARCKAANARAAERQELEATLAGFQPPEHDWKELFERRSAYERDLARYRADLQRYAEWLLERKTKELRACELTLAVGHLSELQIRLSEALDFEQQLVMYQEQKARFDGISAEVEDKRNQGQNWTKVKDAIAILRGSSSSTWCRA